MRDAAVTVRVARRDELAWFADWAAAEGWNPGPTDMGCFAAEDPAGFFLGLAGGVPVAAISVVNYGAAFAFLGFYIVPPEARGRGFGLATWRAALPHAGQRVVGLDGVVAQQANYARSGFVLAYRNIRYGGTPARAGRLDPAVVVPDATLDAALGAYDGTCFPAPRPRFLAAWTRAPGHVVRALVRDGALAGYGVARPCREGVKIGPLFADTRADAEALFDALLAGSGAADPVFLDVPEANAAAVALAAARGLAPRFETARMYTGAVRPVRLDRVFGVTSFELG